MKKPIAHHQRIACGRLSAIEKLSKKLLEALEAGDCQLLEDQSTEALVMLLKALNQSLELYHERERN